MSHVVSDVEQSQVCSDVEHSHKIDTVVQCPVGSDAELSHVVTDVEQSQQTVM